MWQENSSRRSRSPHQCQIRRLYKAIEAIETPHLDTIRNRSPRSPGSARYRGTLGGCEPIMVMEEKQVREPVHEEKEVDSPVPEKAAKILGCWDDAAQRRRARKVRRGSGELARNVYDTPPDTPIMRESFELEGGHSRLIIDTTIPSITELDGSPVFSSVSWSGENRHELPATPATPTEDWDRSLMPHPLRLSKSSICISTAPYSSHNSVMGGQDAWISEDTAEISVKSRRSSYSIRHLQTRPVTICAPQSVAATPTTSSQSRSQGLRKVKARHDLRIPSPNTYQSEIPVITVTNPTLERPRQRSARAEKAQEAGFDLSPVISDVLKEERKWEEITEAADLKICMAVLAKEIARRRMETRS